MSIKNCSLLNFFVLTFIFAGGVQNAHARGSFTLSVDAVNWKEPHLELTAKGKGEPLSHIDLYVGGTDLPLASLTADENGRWYFVDYDPQPIPCTIRAESSDSVAEKEVASAPLDCVAGATSPDGSVAGTADQPIVNNPPQISGTPDTTVTEGAPYEFTPTASDPDGDSITFSIVNRPAWASFSTATGTLSGVPGIDDAGSYNSVEITVSDGSASASLSPFSITVANVNQPPTISGTPSSTVEEGTSYSFTPTVYDPDGDPITFVVTNLPGWATFDAITGQMRGTPGTADIGVYDNVLIAASDGMATAALEPVSITVTPATATATTTSSATISWTAPVARADGTALAPSEINGYRILMGNAPDELSAVTDVNEGSAVQYTVEGLSSGTFYFGVTAYDMDGRESAVSDVLELTM